MPSSAMRTAARRYASIITFGLDDFIESTRSRKFSASQMRTNSSAASTMPAGVSPKRRSVRSASEP